jgi:hypothetical protein
VPELPAFSPSKERPLQRRFIALCGKRRSSAVFEAFPPIKEIHEAKLDD